MSELALSQMLFDESKCGCMASCFIAIKRYYNIGDIGWNIVSCNVMCIYYYRRLPVYPCLSFALAFLAEKV